MKTWICTSTFLFIILKDQWKCLVKKYLNIFKKLTSNVNESSVIARSRDFASADGLNVLITAIDFWTVAFDVGVTLIDGTSIVTVFFDSRASSFFINDK